MDNPLEGFPWRELPLAIAYRLSRDELIDVRDDGAVKTFSLAHFGVHFAIRLSDDPRHEIEISAQLQSGHGVKAFASPTGDFSLDAQCAGDFVTAALAQALLEPKKSRAATELNARCHFRAMCDTTERPIIPEGADEAFLAGITSIKDDQA